MGSYEVSLGDTIGVGTPGKVLAHARGRARSAFRSSSSPATITTPTAWRLANIYASFKFGLRAFDSSVAGLGGCPYAKGASGNVATEDVVYLLAGLGVQTGIDLDKLIDTSAWISSQLGREPGSKVTRAVLAKRTR